MKTIRFLAAKRLNDIQKLKLKWKDIKVGDGDRVKIWMTRSKTDVMGLGCYFKLTRSKLGSVSVTELVEWPSVRTAASFPCSGRGRR